MAKYKNRNVLNRKSVKINAILNVIKQLLAIAFPMITFPYATRILGVETYGVYTFSYSILNYISYIAAAGILRYAVRECAKVRDDRKKFIKLVNEIYTINILTTILSFVFLFFILIIPAMTIYRPVILILSLSVIFTTLGTDWINNAFEDYFFITIRYIFSQLVALCLLFIFVKSSADIMSYSFITIIGGVIANVMNIFHINRTLKIHPKLVFSYKKLKKHIKPILYLFVCTIATFIYINSDITILRIYSDNLHVAYYGVATKFYQLVKDLINAAFIVIMPRIAYDLSKNKELVNKKLNTVLNITIIVIFPCSIGLFFMRNSLITLFSGSAYLPASTSLAILAITLIPSLLANFVINIVMIPYGFEKYVMFGTLISALINLVLNFVFIPIFSETAAAFTTFIAEVTLVVFGFFKVKKIYRFHIMKSIISSVIGCILIGFTCYFTNNYFEKSVVLNLICAVTASIILYSLIITITYKKIIFNGKWFH